MTSAPAARTRDAARTRARVLDAAEAVFAGEGYDAASLARIGDAAGVSRGTPSYFFGSKEELYQAVLERMYADRTAALQPAFGALAGWAESDAPAERLREVLDRAVGAYLDFLWSRPAYVDIIEREAVTGAERLPRLQNQSTVMEDAFSTLRRHAGKHRLRDFEVSDAVITLVGLGFTPVAHRHTMLPRHGIAYDDAAFVERHRRHIVEVLLHMLGAG